MILSNKIQIRINPSNINHYKSKYDNIKINDLISVNITDLTKGSKYKVEMKCDNCGSIHNIAFNILYKTDFNNFICKKCKREKTNIEKYGVKNVFQSNAIKEKSKNTIKEKYGVDNISQSKDIKNKKIKTFLNKYGTKYALSSDIIKQKTKNTVKEKYGVNNISQLDIIKSRKEETCLKNYGVKIISQHKEFKKNINNTILKKLKKKYNNLVDIKGDDFIFYCEKCQKNFNIYKKAFYSRLNLNVNNICTICNPIGSIHSSCMESDIFNLINNNTNNKILKNDKTLIKPYELDIYIPELKLAFEFNGLFWHNENNIGASYHLNKTEKCESKGVQLIHIWEDDWLYKQEIVKSMILNKLNKIQNKIYARKCKIKEINDNKLIKEFLEKNHIEGFIGSKIKIGLFYNGELVALMTFGNRKISNEIEFELLRFCNKLNSNVIGGASKLFKYFINKYIPKKIITYANRSFSQGKLYENLGFKFVNYTSSNYYYIINRKRHHRFNFRKDILVKQGFDKSKTEHEIMLSRNYYRIYDCGNLKFELNLI